jgi:aldose 1-epimerase
MAGQVRCERRDTSGADGTVWVLEDGTSGRAEVWPALGFNCYRWQVVCRGRARELLYADPQLFRGGAPTRSGVQVLFPFPNRIRDGWFRWQGQEYHLPPNDPSGKNAIHGFACRRPWRVVDEGATAESAWITGEFRGAVEAADVRELWPTDYLIRVTHRLSTGRLRIEAVVENPDRAPLPFGLGYHPYFAASEDDPDGVLHVQASACAYWELKESLPTGRRLPVEGGRDLRMPRLLRELVLDDVLTDLPAEPEMDGLCPRGSLWSAEGIWLEVRASPAFRELVAFTPPHRKAVCLEPYTCTTDAINLQQHGVDAGWLVLPPGEKWSAMVELTLGRVDG